MKTLTLFTRIFLISLIVFSYNQTTAQETIHMQVKENRADCTGVRSMKCLQVKFKHSKGWEFFYDRIIGFDYEEGYRYKLLVNKTKRDNVPADASGYTYELIRIVKQKKKKIPKESLPSPADFLSKHKWKLIQLDGRVIEDSPVHIVFDKEKEVVFGNSGCNTFFGPFNIKGDQISFDKLTGTLMACTPERNKLENEFLTVLRSKDLRFDIAEQTLNIYKDNKLMVMFGLASL